MSDASELFSSQIPRNHIQVKKEKENVKLGIFPSWSCSDVKEMYKKVWCMCRGVVLPIQPIAFFDVLVVVTIVAS